VPGFDEAELLLTMARPREVTIVSLTGLAVEHAAADGLPRLTGMIDDCLAAGRPVVLVDLYDTPADRNPWKFLRRLGYERAALHAALRPYAVGGVSRRAGPFTLRSIPPPPPRWRRGGGSRAPAGR
jgi:hypothetical protein